MASKVFCADLSTQGDFPRALQDLASKVNESLGGKSCDAASLFVSEGYPHDEYAEHLKFFASLVAAKRLIGCNANGVIGGSREIEMEPAVSVLAMHLPAVKITPFSLSALEVETLASGAALQKFLDLYPREGPNFICLADPATCDVTKLLSLFNEAYPGSPLVGGLASGSVVGAENWLLLDGELCEKGVVGLALSGDIRFEVLVSQGCRPIGESYAITKSHQNILYELAGRPPLQVLGDIFAKLPPDDQELVKHSLFVGLAMDERRKEFKRGDFLIRNIVGADKESGALAVGEGLEIGQTLQFQLRDARTSKEDLEILLSSLPRKDERPPALRAVGSGRPVSPAGRSSGAILVTCCGRGRGLYGVADHDTRLIQSARGPLSLTGFFANGEFGPVNKKNYVHGYTSSLTLLR